MAADYYAILKNAIGALPETSGEARRSVYEKARRAVVEQLKAFDPPLSATEITQERLRLEDCIRRVEAEAAKGILTQTLSRTTTQMAPPPREPETRAPRSSFEPPTRSAPPALPERSPTRAYPPPTPEPTTSSRWDRTDRPAERGNNTLMGERVTAERNRLVPPPPPGGYVERRTTGMGSSIGQTPVTGQPTTGFVPRPTTQMQPPPGSQSYEPTTGPAALRRAAETGDQLGAAVAETAEHARNTLLAGAEADAYARRDLDPYPHQEPQPAQADADHDAVAHDDEPVERRSRKPLIIGISAGVVVLAIGAGAVWSQQERIAAYFGDQRPFGIGAARPGATGVPPKSTDRLNSDDQAAAPKPDRKPVQSEAITVPAAGAPAAPPPSATAPTTPVLPPVAQATPTPAPAASGPATGQSSAPVTAPPQQPVPMVAQRVSMMEENPVAGSQPLFSTGKVVWQLVKESQSGKPPANILRARVEIPDRRITMTLSMQPNTDPTFSASHLIEVRFSVPNDFDAKGIANVPGLIMKPNEQATGSPLVGASAKISQNFFWFALAAGDADKQRNLALLKDSGWMSVPIVYETGKRGLITIEKAGAGDRALADAIAAWQ
jgi:hypothetical protein